MSIEKLLIVEDGSCVPDANTFALPEDGRKYFPLRFGGEKWDISFQGEKHCEEDICKALIGAIDIMKSFNWRKQHHSCECCENDLPNPYYCCECDGCGRVYDRLKEAQLIIADALLNGWNPVSKRLGNEPLVTSMSRRGKSINFSTPVRLSSLGGCNEHVNLASTHSVVTRLRGLIGCYVVKPKKGPLILN